MVVSQPGEKLGTGTNTANRVDRVGFAYMPGPLVVYELIAFVALAVSGTGQAKVLLCEGTFYSDHGPFETTFTLLLDQKTLDVRMSLEVGRVEGVVTMAQERYTGNLKTETGAVRVLTLDRYTGDMRLMDETGRRAVYIADCKAAEPRF